MHPTNERMDDLTREVQDLKNSLPFSQGQLDELKQENGKMTAICKSLSDISSVCESMMTMTNKYCGTIKVGATWLWTELQNFRIRPGRSPRTK